MRLGYSLDEIKREMKKEGSHIYKIYFAMQKDQEKSGKLRIKNQQPSSN